MFRYAAPEELPWEFLKAGVEQIQLRCRPTWTLDQVHARLLDGSAKAFVHDEGFVVLERCHEPITGNPYLNVWLMWFKPGEAMKRAPELVAWLDETQRKCCCMWWEFGSPRDEWAATIAPYCEKALTIWRRKQ